MKAAKNNPKPSLVKIVVFGVTGFICLLISRELAFGLRGWVFAANTTLGFVRGGVMLLACYYIFSATREWKTYCGQAAHDHQEPS